RRDTPGRAIPSLQANTARRDSSILLYAVSAVAFRAAAQHRELGHVAPEERRGRPVREHSQAPGQERKLEHVVATGEQPAWDSPYAELADHRDAVATPERGHLASRAIAIRTRGAPEVPGERARLAQGVLTGGRVVGA